MLIITHLIQFKTYEYQRYYWTWIGRSDKCIQGGIISLAHENMRKEIWNKIAYYYNNSLYLGAYTRSVLFTCVCVCACVCIDCIVDGPRPCLVIRRRAAADRRTTGSGAWPTHTSWCAHRSHCISVMLSGNFFTSLQ